MASIDSVTNDVEDDEAADGDSLSPDAVRRFAGELLGENRRSVQGLGGQNRAIDVATIATGRFGGSSTATTKRGNVVTTTTAAAVGDKPEGLDSCWNWIATTATITAVVGNRVTGSGVDAKTAIPTSEDVYEEDAEPTGQIEAAVFDV